MNETVTVKEAASELGISVQAVGYHIKRGKLVAEKVPQVGKRPRWEIARESLDAFKAARAS